MKRGKVCNNQTTHWLVLVKLNYRAEVHEIPEEMVGDRVIWLSTPLCSVRPFETLLLLHTSPIYCSAAGLLLSLVLFFLL